MSFIQRKLSSKDVAAHLARAEWLKAQGMQIEAPPEWRQENRTNFLEVKIGPPPHSAVYELSSGKLCYEFDVRLLAKKSGIPFPEFEITTPWDNQIEVENFDDSENFVRFAGGNYPIEDVLNVYAAEYRTLPYRRAVQGFLLCTGARAIPAEFSDFSAADCTVIVRDPGTGEIFESLVKQIAVMRSPRQIEKPVLPVPTKGSLYAGDLDAARRGPIHR